MKECFGNEVFEVNIVLLSLHMYSYLNGFLQNQSPLTVSSVKASSSSSSNKDGGKDSNKDMADRLDMPPPPSPASSTCSDTSTSHSKFSQLFTCLHLVSNKCK